MKIKLYTIKASSLFSYNAVLYPNERKWIDGSEKQLIKFKAIIVTGREDRGYEMSRSLHF
jgi:hypothetical protein